SSCLIKLFTGCKNKTTISRIAPAITIICLILIILSFYFLFNFITRFYLLNENLCWLKAWNIMLRNNNCSIFGYITSGFLSSLFYYETSESSNVYILTFNHGILYYLKERFNSRLNISLL